MLEVKVPRDVARSGRTIETHALWKLPSRKMRRGMQITVVAQNVRGYRYVAQDEKRGGDGDGERLLASSEASVVLRRRRDCHR